MSHIISSMVLLLHLRYHEQRFSSFDQISKNNSQGNGGWNFTSFALHNHDPGSIAIAKKGRNGLPFA